jgi:hypothetical protein
LEEEWKAREKIVSNTMKDDVDSPSRKCFEMMPGEFIFINPPPLGWVE